MQDIVPPSTPSTPNPTSSRRGSEAADAAQGVDDFVRHLLAYRADSKLYPTDHPRVAERVARLRAALVTLQQSITEPLILEVSDGVLFCRNFSLRVTSDFAQRFVTILRQRMVRSIAFGMGITPEDISAFIQFLLLGDAAPLGTRGTRFKLTDNIEITAFKAKFGTGRGDAAEDIDGIEGEESGEEGAAAGYTVQELLATGEWQGFTPEQLKTVSAVVNNPVIQERVSEIRAKYGVESGGKDFLPAFFSVLRRDAHTNWSNHTHLCEVMSAGLDLLNQARTVRASDGALPASLLAPQSGLSDQLSTHLRWKLLRNFFPGAQEERSPREAEDLSFRARAEGDKKGAAVDEAANARTPYRQKTSIEEWHLNEVPPEAWGQTDPDAMRAGFVAQFSPGSLLAEYTGTVAELVRHEDSNEPKLRSLYRATLRRLATQDPLGHGEIRAIAAQADTIAAEIRIEYECEVIRSLVAPAKVIDYLAGSSDALRTRLLEHGPAPADAAATANDGPAERVRALLLQLLGMRDAYAFELAFEVLSGDAGSRAMAAAWPAAVKALATNNVVLSRWMEERVELLTRQGAERFLVCLPVELLRREMQIIFRTAGLARTEALLRNLTATPGVDATPFLLLGLEQQEPQLRCASIQALGRQRDDRSLQVLEDELRRHNDLVFVAHEADEIVAALANRSDAPSRALLERVVRQRQGWRRRWRRPLRKAARQALRRMNAGAAT